MSEKKFQVFLSSTYTDLIDERKAVEETIIRAGDFPVGMEAFPAADEEQFEFIKTVIEKCDYYILIIAGRYGSLASDGLSYTEKEFQYALKLEIPVLVMLRGQPGSLQADKIEISDERNKKLKAFIKKASTGRIRKEWTTKDGLKLAVRESLDHAKATKPRPGWIRGDAAASTETLMELNDLRKEVLELRKNSVLEEQTFPNIAGLDAEFEVSGTVEVWRRSEWRVHKWKHSGKFREFFAQIAPMLQGEPADWNVKQTLTERLCILAGVVEGAHHKIDDAAFDKLSIQFQALGLIDVELRKEGRAPQWQLTPLGKQKMMECLIITDKDSSGNSVLPQN